MHNKILRLDEVVKTTGMSRSLIYRYIQLKKFPRQVYLGHRICGWVESEVQEWLTKRINSRSAVSKEMTK